MFSKQTQELRQKMLDDSQKNASIENLIGYVLSAVKELDQRLETIENAKHTSS